MASEGRKQTRSAFKFCLFTTLFLFGLYHGNGIKAESCISFMEGLKSSTSIIFGVVAAWIALVYPEELRAKISNSDSGELKSARLFKAFYIASGALLLAITLDLITLTTNAFGKECSGRIALGVCIVASGLQIWSLKLVVFATEHMRFEFTNLKIRASNAKRLVGKYD